MDRSFIDKLMATFEDHQLVRLAQSWTMVSREERKGRLRAVIALSAELERIRAVNIFATGLAEGVIEDIIEGDWKAARDLGQHFTFDTEGPALKADYGPLWAKFVEVVNVECILAQKRQTDPPEGPGKAS
jgi:hypothetical protein